MANTLARMERDGLILRKKDVSDGRVQRIWLTEQARGLRDSAILAAIEENAGELSGLTADERAQFVTLMQKIIATSAPASGR